MSYHHINRWSVASIAMVVLVGAMAARAEVIFEKYSVYHHIQVIDSGGVRTLSFNGSMETKMSLADPLKGHFEYTEYFHTPWLWNTNIEQVLMIGLGGGSTQRSFQHYHTNVMVDTAELDPAVVAVARDYFKTTTTPKHKIYNEDGRVFLRRAPRMYDVILMDAYTTDRYGSSVPPHLTTKEFFKLASDHMSTNGVLAYNVIGQVRGLNADFVGALYRTLKQVFPQIYYFPANESQNVVLVATKDRTLWDASRAQRQGAALVRNGTIKVPNFWARVQSFRAVPPPSAAISPILTDDQAGVEGLLRKEKAEQ
jgi:spermidine synthase